MEEENNLQLYSWMDYGLAFDLGRYPYVHQNNDQNAILKSNIGVVNIAFESEKSLFPHNFEETAQDIYSGTIEKNSSLSNINVITNFEYKTPNIISNRFLKTYTVDFITSANEMSDLIEKNQRILTPGTEDYVIEILGQDVYQKLSKMDKIFFIKASGMINLGENVNIKEILGYLNEDINS